ncbi:F-box/LRR-repeat protein At3g48880-like [Pyrus x bretschneideri]|uniref:F-box/LRR-repeat protein At3g48880-like n=1 Tax=Pyrus x bretschneideri TaxID=225117 RepID=UPI00202F2221|nr:F-box/LRR-repeat protein At3g48880-like [Pyrus x bretschneideri]
MEDQETKKKIRGTMACDNSPMTLGRWEDLSADILWKILDCFDDTSESDDSSSAKGKVNCSAVCKKWRSTLCDPRLWNTLDLSTMKSHFIKTLDKPYVYVCSRSEMALNRALKISLSLSQRNITTLIFNLQLYVPNDLFIYTAERYVKYLKLVREIFLRNTFLIATIDKNYFLEKYLPNFTVFLTKLIIAKRIIL